MILKQDIRYKVLVAGRRFGKSRMAIYQCFKSICEGQYIWYVAPEYKQLKTPFRKTVHLLNQIPVPDFFATNKADFTINTATGGSIAFRSAKNGDALRGEGLDGIVIDEAAFIKREVWFQILQPMLLDRQGWALLISSPARPNDYFHELYKRGQGEDEDWKSWQFTSYHNPFIPDKEIDKKREEVRKDVFSREYLAKFVQAEGTLVNEEWIREFVRVGEQLFYQGTQVSHTDSLTYYIGCDTAISTEDTADHTAYVVIGVDQTGATFVVDCVKERMTLNEQLKKLNELEAKWNPKKVIIEAVNSGIALIQEIQRTSTYASKVVDVKPKGSKAERFSTTALKYEKGLIYHDPGLTKEFVLDITDFTGTGKDPSDDVPDALAHAVNYAARPKKQTIGGSRITVF